VGLSRGLRKSFGKGDVYALDLLGWGLSSRPAFDLVDPTCETAEQFFVQSLEAWRKAQRIDKMILAGHSMGGYLSVAYCEAYPHRVERLILLSPVGVPEKKEDPTVSQAYPLRYRVLFHLATRLWKNGTTPPSFIRSLSEYRGRSIVNSYVEKRLPALIHQDERDALTDYLYWNAILPGSGEYCLNRILNPMAYAKKPLVHRIPHLLVKNVSFVYGALDWMDPWAALDVQRLCDDNEKSPRVQVYGVQHAGHLLMLDNWEEFNAAVLLSCGATQLETNAPQSRLFHNSNRSEAQQFFRKETVQNHEEAQPVEQTKEM
jgi:cardiolipin-specific phospholipase